MQVWKMLRAGWSFAREHGTARFARELHYRAVTFWHERRLGVQTAGMVELADLGIHNPEFVEYAPIGYTALQSVLQRIPLPASNVCLLDYGSGKGRAVVVAATHPFRRVIGVEISPELNVIARGNLAAMRHRRAAQVEIVQSDATDYVVPDDINVVYIFNAFHGQTLARVIDNVRASLEARRRTIYMVFFNKIHFEELRRGAAYDWIKPLYVGHFYPNYSCGIYELTLH